MIRGKFSIDDRISFHFTSHTLSCSIASPLIFSRCCERKLCRAQPSRSCARQSRWLFPATAPPAHRCSSFTQVSGCSLHKTDSMISATYPWYSRLFNFLYGVNPSDLTLQRVKTQPTCLVSYATAGYSGSRHAQKSLCSASCGFYRTLCSESRVMAHAARSFLPLGISCLRLPLR